MVPMLVAEMSGKPVSQIWISCRSVKKQEPVLGGFESTAYKSKREWATAPDGKQVPLSVVYRTDKVKLNGGDPLLLDAYGSYGICNDPRWDYASWGLVVLLLTLQSVAETDWIQSHCEKTCWLYVFQVTGLDLLSEHQHVMKMAVSLVYVQWTCGIRLLNTDARGLYLWNTKKRRRTGTWQFIAKCDAGLIGTWSPSSIEALCMSLHMLEEEANLEGSGRTFFVSERFIDAHFSGMSFFYCSV